MVQLLLLFTSGDIDRLGRAVKSGKEQFKAAWDRKEQ